MNKKRTSLWRAELERQCLWILLKVALVHSLQFEAHDEKLPIESESDMRLFVSILSLFMLLLFKDRESNWASALLVSELLSEVVDES